LVLSVGVVLVVAAAGFAQQRPVQVAGVVRSAVTGEGLAHATVALSSLGSEPKSGGATTGADGTFGISGLPPGQYRLTIRKSGYQPFQATAPVTIRPDSAETTRVTESLWPHGAIAGRVVDWEGEPIAGAEILAYAVVYQAAGAALSLATRGESDDSGDYRLFGLPAGKYVLQVSPPRAATPAGQFYADATAVYYPSAPQPSQALPVDLNWGQDASRTDVKLSRGQTYAIAGAVRDASAEGPCMRCQVQVMQHDGPYRVPLPQTARVTRQGGFVLRGLSPGDYTIVARQGGSKDAVAQEPVSIRNRPVQDARLTVGLQQAVTGEIVLEKPPEGISATDWTPSLLPVALPEWWPGAEGEVRADRQFTIAGVSPGRYRLEMNGLAAGAYLKALRAGGQALANSEIVISQEAGVSGLEAVVAFDGATLTGRVRSGSSDNGQVQAGVFLIPQPNQTGSQFPKTAETTPDGSFSLGSVVPGSYTLYALPANTTVQIFDPAVQAALARYARQFKLGPQETVTAEISLTPHHR